MPPTDPLRIRAFRSLWLGSGGESIADDVSRSLFPIIAVVSLGGTAAHVGVIHALGMAAFLVLGLPIGVWVERMRKKYVMLAADAVRAVALASIPAAHLIGVLTIYQLLLVAAILSVADCFFSSASSVVLPSTVPADSLGLAAGRMQTMASSIVVVISGCRSWDHAATHSSRNA